MIRVGNGFVYQPCIGVLFMPVGIGQASIRTLTDALILSVVTPHKLGSFISLQLFMVFLKHSMHLSARLFPPCFSLELTISLKSPHKSHCLSFNPLFRDMMSSHVLCLFWDSGWPYILEGVVGILVFYKGTCVVGRETENNDRHFRIPQ